MTTTNQQELETTIALVKKDVDNISTLCGKLDANVEKISELANTVSKLLSLHEQRIDNLYQNDKTFDIKLEKSAVTFQEEMKLLHNQMRDNNRDFIDRLKSSEESIKHDIRHVNSMIERRYDSLKETVESENEVMKTSIDETIKKLEASNVRINALERWRWILLGGGTVIMFIVNKSPINFSVLT